MSTPHPQKSEPADAGTLYRRHLTFGWWSLLLFLTLGIVLETLHGFKVAGYLNPPNATRRLMWTLAHAHGTLFALVHLAFAFSLRSLPAWPRKSRAVASGCLSAAAGLMPLGFFLGGVFIHAGDPGLGILLVPAGALLLFVAVLLAALASRLAPPDAAASTSRNR